ncbi:hypothetical protein SBY92_004198 [Candida maltosa Xu316]
MVKLLPLLRRNLKTGFRINHSKILLRHSSSSSSATKFFEENTITPTNHIEDYYTRRSEFINPFAYFNKYTANRQPTSDLSIPPRDFQTIIDQNENNIPVEGSVVEIVTPGSDPKIGVVIRQALSRFDERYNKLLVLTSENDLIEVSSFHVNFHIFRMIHNVNVNQIIENRHDESCTERKWAVSFLNSFVDEIVDVKRSLSTSIDKLYCQFSGDIITSITLLDIIDALKLKETLVIKLGSSFYHQCVLLFVIHWTLIDSPRWMVPNYVANNKSTNVINGYSNIFHTKSNYFVTPGAAWDAVFKFSREVQNPSTIDNFTTFFQKLETLSPLEYKSFLEVYEGRHLAYIIDVLKFAMVYPHKSIISDLQKLSIFKGNIDPHDIYELLFRLKIYDDNGMTDIYLSSGIFGATDDLSITTIQQLNTEKQWIGQNKDLFRHLRSKKNYYRDHVIYGLPLDEENPSRSRFGISLETVNSRKQVLNIHIPDITTIIPPNSALAEKLLNQFPNSTILTNLFNNESLNDYFSQHFQDQRSFHTFETESEQDDFWDDGLDIHKKTKRNISEVTCLTISFEFNSYESDPFKSFEDKISVSFDSISNLNIKVVDRETLEKCLSGKLETKIFKFLRSQTVEKPSDKVKLKKADIHNLNYTHGIMKSFSKMREHVGAATTSPNDDIDLTDMSDLNKNSIDGDTVNSPKTDFFLRELQIFCGALVGEYCSQYNIPICSHNQNIEPTIYDSDKVIVTHDNLMIPAYESENYYHSIMAKDYNSYISLQASLVANNYLSPPTIDAITGENTLLGLKKGYVNVVDIFTKPEAMLNQYQLLFYQHGLFSRKLSMEYGYLKNVSQFNYLKVFGYQVHGSLSEPAFAAQLSSIRQGEAKSKLLGQLMKRYWSLKWLEQIQLQYEIMEQPIRLHVVVTYVREHIDSGILCKGYCFELGIEVDVLVDDLEQHIGTKLVCDEIMKLDPVNGTCLLKDENYESSLHL